MFDVIEIELGRNLLIFLWSFNFFSTLSEIYLILKLFSDKILENKSSLN
jgi:hypothetical protein